MIQLSSRDNLLRSRESTEDSRVTHVELFFDLVFVYAVTQLSHTLLENSSLLGVAQTFLLFMAVWWVWIYTSWVTNCLDPQLDPNLAGVLGNFYGISSSFSGLGFSVNDSSGNALTAA
ncbi:MAG: low temperature requirement protein A [Thermodesulfobacteriota bacterium]